MCGAFRLRTVKVGRRQISDGRRSEARQCTEGNELSPNKVWVETVRGRDSDPGMEDKRIHSCSKLTKELFSVKCWLSAQGEFKDKSRAPKTTIMAELVIQCKACFQVIHEHDPLLLTNHWKWALLSCFRDQNRRMER